jgi:hypothetical protein
MTRLVAALLFAALVTIVQAQDATYDPPNVPLDIIAPERPRGTPRHAAQSSLNTINLAVVDDNEPFVRTVLCRTVANTLSMGFVVRKWSQCSAGKS